MQTRFAIKVGISLLALLPPLAMLARSFGFGFDLSDEGTWVYLLAHPRTPFVLMDQFFWGPALAWHGWTVVEARWVGLAAMLISDGLLIASVHGLLRRVFLNAGAAAPDLWLAATLSLMGVMLNYSIGRPTLGYNTSVAVAANVFLAALLAAEGRASRARVALCAMAMGAANALAFAARPPEAAGLVVLAVCYAIMSRRQARSGTVMAVTAGSIVVTSLLMAGFVAGGYDLREVLRLLSSSAATDHRLSDVLAADAMQIAKVFVVSCVLVAIWLAGPKRYRTVDRIDAVALGVLAVAVGANVLRQLYLGVFQTVSTAGDASRWNPPFPDVSPLVHAVVAALFIMRGLLILSTRVPTLRRWVTQDPDPDRSTRTFQLALVLYGLCLVPVAGTNTGLLHKSLKNMGPLLLGFGLLLPASRLRFGAAAGLVAATSVLVTSALYVNAFTRPYRLDGSLQGHSARLDHPSPLRGLSVSPSIAALQADLERQLRIIGFDPAEDRVLPGPGRDGMAVLVDALILGPPAYAEDTPRGVIVNCERVRRALEPAPPRVVVLDLESLGVGILPCLSGYAIGPPLSKTAFGAVRLLQRCQESGAC